MLQRSGSRKNAGTPGIDLNVSAQCRDSELESTRSHAFNEEHEQITPDITSHEVESATGVVQLKGTGLYSKKENLRAIQLASNGAEEVGQERIDDGQDRTEVKVSQAKNTDPVFRGKPSGEFGRRTKGKKRKRSTDDGPLKRQRLLPQEHVMVTDIDDIDHLDIRSKMPLEELGGR